MLRLYRKEGEEITVRYGEDPNQELHIKVLNVDYHRRQAQIGVVADDEVLIFKSEKPRTRR